MNDTTTARVLAVVGGLALGAGAWFVLRGPRRFPLPIEAVVRDPSAFIPSEPDLPAQRTEVRNPAEARAAFGELSQYFAWDEPGVWPSDGGPIPMDVARTMVEVARAYMDPLRVAFGPIRVTSWYRRPERNAAVGGSNTSAHLTGRAVDFVLLNGPNGYAAARRVADVLASRNLPWDQVIGYETGTHRQHLGIATNNGLQRMLVNEFRPGRIGTDYPVVARYDRDSMARIA